jgi:hypothetical protein
MGLGAVLDEVRALYLSQFAEAAQELMRAEGVRVLSETALRDPEGRPLFEGELGLPMRIDLVACSQDGGNRTLSVDSQRLLKFDEVSFQWSRTLRVILRPFFWDSLSLRFAQPAVWPPLVEWFARWFREDEDGLDGAPLGVVHFMSDPSVVSEGASMTIDLGSAPVESFEDLLDAVDEAGVREVVIDRPMQTPG